MPDNDFGYTLWGKDWVRFAEPLLQSRPDPRLPRARRIARDGKVRVTIDGPSVHAVVHHGRSTPAVSMEVAQMSQEAMVGISRRLSGVRPALTDELYCALADEGHRPVPNLDSVDCSCSADTSRCIHVLAVYYDMALRIDDDPRIALEIQGFFRAPSNNTARPTAATQQRWIALNTLKPADYFAAPQ